MSYDCNDVFIIHAYYSVLHCVTVIAIVIVNYSKILLFDFCFFVYYAHFWLYCLCSLAADFRY